MRRTPLMFSAVVAMTVAVALGTAASASAASVPAAGQATNPAQPYLGNPNATDWLGSYTVNGEAGYATEFGMLEPDQNEIFVGPAAVVTKWGTSISPSDSALLAYLLWKYGDTTDADEAAALSHVIYAKLSAPQTPADLSPANDFRHIAYDAAFHLAKLSAGAQTLVASMLATPAGNVGPWTVDLTPAASATVGTASDWTLQVLGSGGAGVGSVSVQVTVTNATLAGGATSATVTTPANGSALVVPVTATTTTPSMTVTAVAPLDEALSVDAVAVDVARTLFRSDSVTTVTASAAGTATAAASGPILAVTGPRTPPWPAGAAGIAAVVSGVLMLLVAGRPQRRRAHRA